MISVRIADVPVYLHEGGFLQGLDLEKCEESVTVPADALKADDSVANNAELLHLLASSGQLEALKCEWDESACAKAAEGGHLECLKFLHENGCPWDKSTGLNAAADGHLDCLIYAHTHGAPMDDDLCGAAGCNGRLDCLKYLHEHNFPWDAALCRAAAQYGKLDVLQYAHEHGCPWDGDTTFSAAGMAKFDCLISAVQHGCPFDEARYEEWLAGAPPHVPVDKMRAELKANCVQS